MYNNVAGPGLAGSSAGMLATTGSWAFWYFLAAFALIAAGTAVWRIIPRFNLAQTKGVDVSLDEILNQ